MHQDWKQVDVLLLIYDLLVEGTDNSHLEQLGLLNIHLLPFVTLFKESDNSSRKVS